MPRQIPDTTAKGIGDYLDRVYKLIPAELTAAYLAIQSYLGIPQNPADNIAYLVAAGIVLTCLVPLYLPILQGVQKPAQIAISTVSLPIWILNISSPYVALMLSPGWVKGFGLVLILWVLIAPLLVALGDKLGESKS